MEPSMEEKLNAVIELCEEGDPEMCAFLGKEFYYGWNIPQDLDRALRYLTVASENGDAISQFTLGFMYWSGRGTEPDLDKALKWFLLAAEQGVPEAMFNVAKILLTKDFEKNRAEAVEWLKRSANAGYEKGCAKSAAPIFGKLVCDCLLCLFVEDVDLLNIESKLNLIARSSCCTRINSSCDRELSKIKVQINFCTKKLVYVDC